jgi:hypothetical protein
MLISNAPQRQKEKKEKKRVTNDSRSSKKIPCRFAKKKLFVPHIFFSLAGGKEKRRLDNMAHEL